MTPSPEPTALDTGDTTPLDSWIIADAYIPPRSTSETSHESLCVLNPTDADATIRIDALYESEPPVSSQPFSIAARSCMHLRTDDPTRIGGLIIPRGVPYGMIVRTDRGVVVQYSRLDTTQSAYTLMSVFPERSTVA